MFATRRHIIISAMIAGALTAACDDSPTEPTAVEWGAQIDNAALEAAVEVIARPTTFTASIEITDADPDDTYTWRVAAGTCAAPGDRIGAANRYPALEIAANGTAEAEASVTAVLNQTGSYIVSVLDETGAQPVVVGCAALTVTG